MRRSRKKKEQLPKKILVRLPEGLGSVVLSLAFVRVLAKLCPTARIDLIVEEKWIELVQLFPHIATVHPYSQETYRGLRGKYRFARNVKRQEKYDVLFLLSNSWSSVWTSFLMSSRRRVGYRKYGRRFLLTHGYNRPRGLHQAETYVHLLRRYFRLEALPVLDSSLSLPLSSRRHLASGSHVVLHFGSSLPSCALPEQKAIHLVRTIAEHIDAQFIFVGSRRDMTYYASIRKALPPQIRISDLSGQTSVTDLAYILAESDLVISTDSAPAHLANALEKPLVVFMGAYAEALTGAYDTARMRFLRAPAIPCAPCLSELCKYGEPRCLVAIETAQVLEAIASLSLSEKFPSLQYSAVS